MNDKIYSYHTFILPFYWEMPGVSVDNEYKALKSVFEDNLEWENNDLKDPSDIMSKFEVESFEDVKWLYKEYQYFYPYVRKSFYGYEDDICTNYLLKKSRNNGEYRITKTKHNYVEDTDYVKTYILKINAIRVRLVNTGIALFIMECENQRSDQADKESIMDINDYGRRITLPYIAEHDYKYITADRLEVEIPGVGIFSDDYKGYLDKTCEAGKVDNESISFDYMCDFIKEILSYGGRSRFTSMPAAGKDEIHICPLLDDRMYVAFAVENADFVLRAVELDKNDHRYGISDKAFSESLYQLAYADNSGGCTCPDGELRNRQLADTIYGRWFPWETFYTITEIGFGMYSSAEIGGGLQYLYESFLICYLPMVCITLAQWASIVKFNRETADIAKHFSANGRKLRRADIRKISNLQERHSAFNSQLFFSQISPELQAVEMYDMFKKSFRLEAENELLNKNLESLYEITNTELNTSVNTSVSILTWVSIILAAGALLYGFLFTDSVRIEPGAERPDEMAELLKTFLFLGIITLLSVASALIIIIRNRRR